MILTLLERLERQGGGSRPKPSGAALAGRSRHSHAAPRWCVRAGASEDGSSPPVRDGQIVSSGRFARDGSLLAERSDDGVFVAEGAAQERIVWVGDLSLTAERPAASALGEPAIRALGGAATGLDLAWKFGPVSSGGPRPATILTLRLTLPCRPAGEVTFINEDFDGEIWTSVSREGRRSARMRPYASLPEIELIPSEGSLEPSSAPEWHRGVEVMHPSGEHAVEDRYSPGAFRWSLPAGVDEVTLSIRLMDEGAAARARASSGRATSRLVALTSAGRSAGRPAGHSAGRPEGRSAEGARPMEPDDVRLLALSLPGRLLLEGSKAQEQGEALRALVSQAAALVDGDRFDVALWTSRAALLLAPRPTGSLRTLLQSFHGRLLSRIERDAKASGSVGAALAGLPRWSAAIDSLGGGHGHDAAFTAVEHAALAHQAARFAEVLSGPLDAGGAGTDPALAASARRLARRLRRWFQDSFWLAAPGRAADLATSGAGDEPLSPALVRALSLRPAMLMAASMEGAPFSTAQRQTLLRAVEERLVVPELGVASLERDDLEFGGYSPQDGAAWPFLAGMFVEASLRAYGHERGRERALQGWLSSLHLDAAPMAWGHSGGAPTSSAPYADPPFRVTRRPMPLGSLDFPLNACEGARARALLADGLPASMATEPTARGQVGAAPEGASR